MKQNLRKWLFLLPSWATLGLASPPPKKKLKLVSLNDPSAKAFKYFHDAAEVPKALGIKPGTNCKNCIQYRKKGEIDGAEVGQCNIIPAGMVTAKGWCRQWMKRP